MQTTLQPLTTDPRFVVVHSTDRAVPDAVVHDGHAFCPTCDARLRLDETLEGIPTGVEYQLHYVDEHVLPAIRYEETSL